MSSVQIRWHFMWLICQADKSHVMSSLIFAEIRKKNWKCYLLNMLSAWRFNPWHGSNTFCCHVGAFCYLISDQVATTCYLRKKLISNTESYVYPNNPKGDRRVWANSVHPDITVQNAVSDQDLYCLPLIQHPFKHISRWWSRLFFFKF